MIARPTIGLALGGGGARGLAHIGLLRVLEEEGIPIDLVVGTSMGGLIAALYASGMSPAQLAEETERMCGRRALGRLASPLLVTRGIFNESRTEEWLASLLGGLSFGDLRLRTAVVAVDLVARDEVVLWEGPVAAAVRATIALPGFFSPVEMDGRVLVDGGVLNNVPADVARRMGAEVLIAVSVGGSFSPPASPQRRRDRGHLPIVAPIREVTDVLYQSLGIMIDHLTRERLAKAAPEVLVVPPLPSDMSVTMGFARYQEAIDAGVAAGRAAVAQIRAALERRPAAE